MLPADRMLNAIQARMVEEALVEKETYEAMETMRARIDAISGSDADPIGDEAELKGQHKYPPLPDLPQGKPPERWDTSEEAGVKQGPIPTEVMALGDPLRDTSRPVAPYVPPTTPSSGSDPFPDLGPKGQPLG